MHLVNIKTLELEEFIEGSIPKYAILSHRWTNEELNFKEVLKKRANNTGKRGFTKLLRTCQVASDYGMDYVWIDTCCIDKRSSAELSEAINSMFAWYENAEVCIAYLEDVDVGPKLDESFQQSVWFTRSWTLQELLAPDDVQFYDRSWVKMGDKKSKADLISETTGIQPLVVSKQLSVTSRSIAERMSWASNRTATRSEDIAYSLLGIFEVNMALLYGEGSRAFLRLQEELIQRTEDSTFLLWGLGASTSRLLANSPAEFQDVKGTSVTYCRMNNFSIVNLTLEIETEAVRLGLDTYGLAVAHGFDCTYSLKIRKLPWRRAFYRMGLFKLPLKKKVASSEIRKYGILLDREAQLRRLWELSDERIPRNLGIVFDIENDFPLQVSLLRKDSGSVTELSPSQHPLYPRRRCILVEFHDASQVQIAELSCQLSDNLHLSCYVTYDFDCHPYALLWNKSERPDDRSIVDVFTQSNRILSSEEKWMSEVLNTRLNAEAFLFGGDPGKGESPIRAQIPEKLLGGGRDRWVIFKEPSGVGDRSINQHWVFRVFRSNDFDTHVL